MSWRIKHIKTLEKAMASRFLHRAEHWVGINSNILENCKHSLDLYLKPSLGENVSLDHHKKFMISILNHHWIEDSLNKQKTL